MRYANQSASLTKMLPWRPGFVGDSLNLGKGYRIFVDGCRKSDCVCVVRDIDRNGKKVEVVFSYDLVLETRRTFLDSNVNECRGEGRGGGGTFVLKHCKILEII